MQLLDACLTEDESEACCAFCDAMTKLRRLHDAAPNL